jgi:hypothetical protein
LPSPSSDEYLDSEPHDGFNLNSFLPDNMPHGGFNGGLNVAYSASSALHHGDGSLQRGKKTSLLTLLCCCRLPAKCDRR